ncbi:hypothetical protein GK047_11735 [Paenibacillus sp. SYP-B3998]|uniref:Uncharacterized protein n=1 Tax=Paenibacillus sp. SYP-B3998 TaxID=2678564 RepID=A0A6G3ZX45_9BACL|nr:hypothetical protein [Paenibacillus sp. SYP-B3998]NEW06685.1 hypothetical protein [Paenibacillus sp. SYP-B3998]
MWGIKSKEKFLANWQVKRAMGKKKYVLIYGFFGFGILLAILFSAIELITSATIATNYLFARIIVLPTCGIILLSSRWESQEKKFAKEMYLKTQR